MPLTGAARGPSVVWALVFMFFGLASLGCAPTSPSTVSEFSSQHLSRVALLTKRYGELETPSCLEQFRGILRRLGASEISSYSVRLLATSQPVAFSPGARTILLSRGLVRLLSSEAQVAFAIAHELSHYYLGHLEEVADLPESERSEPDAIERRKDLELAADKSALTLLVRAGYEPTEAIAALQLVYRHVASSPERSLYPSLAERIASIIQLVATARTELGPGTTNRRDFAHCRASLH